MSAPDVEAIFEALMEVKVAYPCELFQRGSFCPSYMPNGHSMHVSKLLVALFRVCQLPVHSSPSTEHFREW